jgi:hypothetical protein
MILTFVDIRATLCFLVRNPGSMGLAIITLALGIGANTSTFSVIQGVLLKPLPYADSDRLTLVWETNPAQQVTEADWRRPARGSASWETTPGGSPS